MSVDKVVTVFTITVALAGPTAGYLVARATTPEHVQYRPVVCAATEDSAPTDCTTGKVLQYRNGVWSK